MRKLAVFALTIVSTVSTAAVSGMAMAESPYWYQCTHQGSERQIVVAYPDEPNPVPCKVHYNKYEIGQQQSTKVIWNAQFQTGYCESKADDFADKQRDWGWACQRIAGTPLALDAVSPSREMTSQKEATSSVSN